MGVLTDASPTVTSVETCPLRFRAPLLREKSQVSYDFTEEQAEAIVTLQLYRLTNTDGCLTGREKQNFVKRLPCWRLLSGMKDYVQSHEKNFVRLRRSLRLRRLSSLEDTAKAIEIDTASLIAEEVYLRQRDQGRLYQAYQPTFLAAFNPGRNWQT